MNATRRFVPTLSLLLRKPLQQTQRQQVCRKMSTPSAAAASDPSAASPTLIVYALPGSQFVAKVLAALQHRKIPHYVKMVPLEKEKRVKVIPSGGFLVPELKIVPANRDEAEPVIVSDSEKILHYMDDNNYTTAATRLFPNDLASELSVRASDTKLAGFVWYYNWVHEASHGRSLRATVRQAVLPWWLNYVVPNWLINLGLKGERAKFRAKAAAAIGVENDAELEDEPKMRALLVEELKFFQSHLQAPTDQQPYLVPGTTQPTAADFSVYPQVERLVGGDRTLADGDTNPFDVTLPAAAIPELTQQEESSLARLWEWHVHMRKTCPVQFKNKRPPVST